MKNKFINEEDIQKKFGVKAEKVIDVQWLFLNHYVKLKKEKNCL